MEKISTEFNSYLSRRTPKTHLNGVIGDYFNIDISFPDDLFCGVMLIQL